MSLKRFVSFAPIKLNHLAFGSLNTNQQLDILKIKDLKTTNRDCKKANKQDIRYCSIDSKGQDNIQLPL